MVRIITFVSGKGGVGKTTVTANIGIALAQMGQKVLMVDGDISMANLSLMLGMESSPITINDVLKGEASVDDIIYHGPEKTQIIPASLDLQDFKHIDISKLPSIIKALAPKYDFILIDSPAGVGEDTLAAMSSSTEVMIIINPYSLSIADSLKTKITAQKINAKPVGIIVNMVQGFKGEVPEKEIVRMLELPSYGSIEYDEEVRKTFFHKKVEPIITKDSNNPASISFRTAASRILGKEVTITSTKSTGFFAWLKGLFRRS